MILVFAGAGASKATSPTKYPTTIDFYKQLPREITGDPLFEVVDLYLRRNQSKDALIDIEQTLWALDDLSTDVSAFEAGRNLLGALFQNPQILGAMTSTTAPLVSPDLLRKLENDIFQLKRSIDALVYNLYSEQPTPDELNLAWIPLLEGLIRTGDWIEVFTTNYDGVIEDAIDELQVNSGTLKISTGRTPGVRPHLHLGLWKEFKGEYAGLHHGGILTKLHGSVDWSRSGNTIHVGTPLFTGDISKHIIIYPGFKDKKDVSFGEPFSIFHHHFAAAVENADSLIFIGYSFRDNRINSYLKNLKQDAKIFTINPSEIPIDSPLNRSQTFQIIEGFNQTSVMELMDKLAISSSAYNRNF